jgi:hypothetical protein
MVDYTMVNYTMVDYTMVDYTMVDYTTKRKNNDLQNTKRKLEIPLS